MILVLGSSHFVGRHLAQRLAERGLPVRLGWHSQPPGSWKGETVRVDAETGEGLEEAFRGVRRAFLLLGSVADQEKAEGRVVEAAKASGCERMVYLSILAAESEAFPFARRHRATERSIEASGMPWVFLRPGALMQNYVTHYRNAIRYEGELALPCGKMKEAPVDARDVARVAAEALADDRLLGRAVDLTGPAALSFAQTAAIVSRAAGREVRYREIGEEDYRQRLAGYGIPRQFIDDLIEMFRFHAALREPVVSSAYREVMGQPPTAFEKFAADYCSFWR